MAFLEHESRNAAQPQLSRHFPDIVGTSSLDKGAEMTHRRKRSAPSPRAAPTTPEVSATSTAAGCYLELGSIGLLLADLRELGIVTRRRQPPRLSVVPLSMPESSSRPPLLTLMPLAVAPRAPKWRRWFGVDIMRK
jgi:hypothetical protein